MHPTSFAHQVRLDRIHHHGSSALLVVPLDHSFSDGPMTSAANLDPLLGSLAESGVDAVILHKGKIRAVSPAHFRMMSLIVHLSAGTSSGADPEAKTLVCRVGEALRLGADAVSVHINLGSATEQRQLADAARVSDLCDRWNLPLLAMIYIRGSRAEQAADPAALAHVTAVATDLGADMVKMGFAGTVEEMSEVVRSSSIPVLVAGGPARPASNEIDSTVRDAMRAGAHGVAIGRNIFQAPDPAAVARRLAAIVHAPCQHTANRPYEPIPPRQSGIGNPTLWHRGGLREDRLDRPAGQR